MEARDAVTIRKPDYEYENEYDYEYEYDYELYVVLINKLVLDAILSLLFSCTFGLVQLNEFCEHLHDPNEHLLSWQDILLRCGADGDKRIQTRRRFHR